MATRQSTSADGARRSAREMDDTIRERLHRSIAQAHLLHVAGTSDDELNNDHVGWIAGELYRDMNSVLSDYNDLLPTPSAGIQPPDWCVKFAPVHQRLLQYAADLDSAARVTKVAANQCSDADSVGAFDVLARDLDRTSSQLGELAHELEDSLPSK